MSVKTELNRSVPLRGGYSIAFFGLLGVVLVVVGAAGTIAGTGATP